MNLNIVNRNIINRNIINRNVGKTLRETIPVSMFHNACCDGDLALARLFLPRYFYDMDVCNDAFVSACIYGRLDVVQWLLTVKPELDVSAVDKTHVSMPEIIALLEEHDLPKARK